MDYMQIVPLVAAVAFFLILTTILFRNGNIFTKKHGRKHAITGLCYLILLILGLVSLTTEKVIVDYLTYDSFLGILGITLTLTAAYEFKHKNIVNSASGTLDDHATVTHDEMIEHSFYQGLNLVQVLYLHALSHVSNLSIRLLLALAATLPWILRASFPINKFSDNYSDGADEKSSQLVRILYRLKKYQYVFYKHFLLHGLNVSVALHGSMNQPLVSEPYFRLYWLLLNSSYVMEFFLQTLVKKGYLSQTHMLKMQKLLMLASTIAAARVLRQVDVVVCCASLFLNFTNRKHDVLNTAVIIAVSAGWYMSNH